MKMLGLLVQSVMIWIGKVCVFGCHTNDMLSGHIQMTYNRKKVHKSHDM